ncbi:hypothetical protein [Ligilactobacillus faecis]|nr:hypothetical protein [Ligilactobacillus faecis]WGN90295.1 hypothetical protein QFX10_04325 [Ligilactobacillus faecis]
MNAILELQTLGFENVRDARVPNGSGSSSSSLSHSSISIFC